MKKTLTAMLLAGIMATGVGVSAQEQLAFPGAEGFGRFAKGARAVATPEVYHVTNLNDSGPGSLRDAVSKGGRVVVFDVSGTIILKDILSFKGNSTILGQTAPGEGINIYGGRVSFSGADNIIVRYLRVRNGAAYGAAKGDACGVAHGENMIFDHMSVLWGRDETFSVSWDDKGTRPSDITIQNSIIGQGLQTHSAGALIQTIGGVTLYRNLYVENNTRNPKVKGLNQYVNNVVYNWGGGGCYIMSDSPNGVHWADIEGNAFVKGPWGGSAPFIRGVQSFKFYGAGNYYDENANWYLDGHEMTTNEMIGESGGTPPYSTPIESLQALNADIDAYNTANNLTAGSPGYIRNIPAISKVMTAKDAYAWIIENVGPVLPVRDVADQYIIDLIKSNGKKGSTNGISSEKQLPHKGDVNLSGGVKPLDTDGDGMPDAWESANGLNPNDANDAVAVASNGYLNIENYANQITEAYPYIKKPVNLTAGEPTKTEVSLTWELNSNTENGFTVELSTDGTTYTEKATAAAGATTCTITDLQPRTKYWVRVRSTDGKGLYSDYTPAVEIETIGDPSVPAASVNPFPANNGKEGIASGLTFTWENDVKTYAGELTYDVWLGTDKAALTKVATGLTTPEWTTKDLEADKTYYWRVDATNTLGTTSSEVWSFSTTAGGVLFYADFYTLPEEYGAAYAEKLKTENYQIFASGTTNKTETYNGMVIGVGTTKSRVVAMKGSYSDDMSKDYGPATTDDTGASTCALQFTEGNAYVTTPTVQGPCVVTYYLGNTGNSQQTAKLYIIAGGNEKSQDIVLGAKKRIFKHTIIYPNAGEVQFRLEANGKKFNVNDILIERYIAPDGNEPLEMTSGSQNNEISYADDVVTIGFNQVVAYNGNATIKGKKQFENIDVAVSGTKLNITYEALDINSEYVISFPEGVLTNADGTKSFVGDIKLTTSDFAPAKQSGETHFGKAAKTLPLNFAPFNTMAPFETVGTLVQEKQNDYPHWVSASEEITADYATMNKTSDKIMTYFEGKSAGVALEIEYIGDGNPRLKVQESRNCDIAPGWRTLRVLEKDDFPFNGTLPLNPETRMVKLAPVAIGGSLKVKTFRIADANGSYGDDYQTGITSINADDSALIIATADGITVTGIADTTAVSVYDISGRTVAAGVGESTFTLASGLYIVQIQGGKTVKVRI